MKRSEAIRLNFLFVVDASNTCYISPDKFEINELAGHIGSKIQSLLPAGISTYAEAGSVKGLKTLRIYLSKHPSDSPTESLLNGNAAGWVDVRRVRNLFNNEEGLPLL